MFTNRCSTISPSLSLALVLSTPFRSFLLFASHVPTFCLLLPPTPFHARFRTHCCEPEGLTSPQYRPDSDHRVHCRITIISSCTDGVWRRRRGGGGGEGDDTGRTELVVVHQYNRRADGGGGGEGSEWRIREGGLKASSLHFGSEHRRTNDVLIILGGGVSRAVQKLRTVKSDVQWELIGDEVVKGYITSIYIYTKVEFNRSIGPLFNRITRYYYCITRRSIFNLSGNVGAYEY